MCHVLVIEDEWIIGEHIEAIAREGGASSVDRAETEQEAIDAALANPPAVILSDVKLAEGTALMRFGRSVSSWVRAPSSSLPARQKPASRAIMRMRSSTSPSSPAGSSTPSGQWLPFDLGRLDARSDRATIEDRTEDVTATNDVTATAKEHAAPVR